MTNEKKTKKQLQKLSELHDTIVNTVTEYNKLAKECNHNERMAYMYRHLYIEDAIDSLIDVDLDEDSEEYKKAYAEALKKFNADEYVENLDYVGGSINAPHADAWFPSSVC